MIARYTNPEMGAIWTDTAKWQRVLEVELAACDAAAELGYIPKDAVQRIREKVNAGPVFTVERILEIEAVTHHDLIAFLTTVAENVGN